jgi:hypothetical protein
MSAPAYTPEVGHKVTIRRWEVPCPELPGTTERRLLVEYDGTIATARGAGGPGEVLLTLEGLDEAIFTGDQFTGQDPEHGCSWTLRTEVFRQPAPPVMPSGILTETRKQDRAIMADYVAGLARWHGLAAEVGGELPGVRRTEVNITCPHGLQLTVRFRGDSPHAAPNTYVLSWHSLECGYRLVPGMFDDVNPYHGGKATDRAYDFNALATKLSRRFASIADGSAFEISG